MALSLAEGEDNVRIGRLCLQEERGLLVCQFKYMQVPMDEKHNNGCRRREWRASAYCTNLEIIYFAFTTVAIQASVHTHVQIASAL